MRDEVQRIRTRMDMIFNPMNTGDSRAWISIRDEQVALNARLKDIEAEMTFLPLKSADTGGRWYLVWHHVLSTRKRAAWRKEINAILAYCDYREEWRESRGRYWFVAVAPGMIWYVM